jgi:hypothetical protein
MKDWMGQELAEGDFVAYATTFGGSSGTMTMGRIHKMHPSGAVTVMDIAGSRGRQVTRQILTDTRTNTAIGWKSYDEHTAKPAHWIHDEYPGVEFTWEQRQYKVDHGAHWKSFHYVDRKWKDYVEHVTHPVLRTLNAKAGVKTLLRLPDEFVLDFLTEEG